MFKVEQKKIEGKPHLVITMEANESPVPSSSGKSNIIATTGGNKASDLMINGKPVIVGINAYIKN